MANAERIDEAVEADGPPRFDSAEELLRGGRAPPFPVGKLRGGAGVADLERENIRRRLDQAIVVEGLDVLLAESFDVEGVARHEVLQALDALRRADQPAGAAAHRIDFAGDRIHLAHRMAAASRTKIGKGESFRGLGPLLLDHAENLRDDVAGTLDDDGIADADVLARDLVFIVQGGVLHDDAADGHRLELGDGGQRAGASDLNFDVVEDGGRLLGREFVRDGVARRTRDEAQTLLEIEPVELVDDAVDIVVEPGAAAFELTIGVEHLFHALREAHQRVDGKAVIQQRPVDAPLRICGELRHLAPSVGEELQGPGGGDRGIELAQGTGGGIARVGKASLAAFGLAFVQALKGAAAHIDLAAHLKRIGEALGRDPLRDVGDGADIGGDVLAFVTVAAGGALNQAPLLVAERDGEAIDLRLGGEGEALDRVEAEEAADALQEIAQPILVEHVAERQHRHAVGDFAERFDRRRPDPEGGAILAHQMREAGLDRQVPLAQRIVGGI